MTLPPSSVLISPALQPGDKLSYFEVAEPMASGGMSLLWKGRDSLLGRDVVIKQMSDASHVDEAARERFRQLAELQKKLSEKSDRLVKVIDMIDEPRGLFIVMEFVEGMSLEQALGASESPMDPKQGLNLIYCLAMTLKEIHDAGILHRDLKPSNIMLAKDGKVKVADFGLATILDDQDPLTHGSTRYMAPELFGEEPAQPRADIYSLGMVAYEVLAGRGGFNQTFRTVLRDERNQALRWMKWHTNPRLSAQPVQSVNSKVPQPLSDLVARMMEKDPSQRIPTADLLLEAIKRNFTSAGQAQNPVAGGKSPSAEPVADESPTAPLPKKSKVPMLLGLNAVILLLLVGGLMYYLKVYQPQQRQELTTQVIIDRLKEGHKAYDAKQFDQALPIYQDVIDKWPDSPMAETAGKGIELCKGYMNLEAGLWIARDSTDFEKARQVLKVAQDAFQAAYDKGAMVNDAKAGTDLHDKWYKIIPLHRSRLLLLMEYRDAIAKGDFMTARDKRRDLDGPNLPEPYSTRLAELVKQFEGRTAEAAIDTILREVNDLVGKGQTKDALALLDDAQRRHGDNARLMEKIKQLIDDTNHRAALEAAERAIADNNFAEAIINLEKANKIRHSDERSGKIKQLYSSLELTRGYNALKDGNTQLAKQHFEKSIEYGDNPQAKEALADMAQTAEFARLISEANAKFDARNFAECVALAERAKKLRQDTNKAADPRVQQLINAAQVRLHCQIARKLFDDGALDKAEMELDKALVIAPADPRANAMTEELKERRVYLAHLANGDKLYGEKLYGDALKPYRAALDVAKKSQYIDPTFAQKKVDDTQFDYWMEKADQAIKIGDWKAAEAALSAALKFRDDPEAQKTLEFVRGKISEQG